MQTLLVGVIVAWALVVVVQRYAPDVLQRAVRSRCAHLASRVGWSSVAHRLKGAPSLAHGADGCASCSSGCNSGGGCGANAVKPVEQQEHALVFMPQASKTTVQR